MYVVDGEGFEKEKSGVWIDSYLANNLNLKVGDEISFTYIYAAIGTFVVAIFVDSKLSKKIKTIDMVSSLKANE